MDSSETIDGKRERAHAGRLWTRIFPANLWERNAGRAIFAEVVEEGAQRRHPEMKRGSGAQARMDPGAPFVMHRGGPVLSVWVADEYSRFLGRELTEAETRAHANLASKGKEGELDAWKQGLLICGSRRPDQRR